jgi:16S rRNA processing protein RimM
VSPASSGGASSGDANPLLLEVGRVVAPHGIRGEVVVVLVTNRTERLAPGSRLCVGSSTLLVEGSRPHRGAWLVRFAGEKIKKTEQKKKKKKK